MSKQMKTRNREHTHKWTESETRTFLTTILENIKENPRQFMKPSCFKYLSELCKAPELENLSKLNYQALRDKLRYQRNLYDKALKILSAADDDEFNNKTLEGNVLKICPHFAILKEMYERLDKRPTIVDNTDDWDSMDSLYYDDKLETDGEHYWTPLTETEIMKMANNETASAQVNCKRQFSDNYDILVKKLQKQEELEEQKLQLERERLQLEKDQLIYKKYFEKYKIDKEFELRRYEIELKYKRGSNDEEI